MDQPIYAHNKSLMESNACQKNDDLVHLQNQRAGEMQFYQPSGSLFPTTAVPARPPWPSQNISHQDNQLHNGPLNGFQQDISFDQKVNTVESHGLSQGPPPNVLTPLSGRYVASPLNHPDPILPNSGFFPQPHQQSQPASSTFLPRPPVASQRQTNPQSARPMYTPSPSTSGYYPPPLPENRQSKGSYLGDLPISTPSSRTDSPSGSLYPSRSETPVRGNVRYQDQLRNQSFASQNMPLGHPLHSTSQISHAPTLTNVAESDVGPHLRPASIPPSHFPDPQAQPLPQPWQHQGPPQLHQTLPWQPPHLSGHSQPWTASQSQADQGPNQPLHQQVPWPLPTNQQIRPQPLSTPWPRVQGQSPQQQPQVLPGQQSSWQRPQFPQSLQPLPQNHLSANLQGLPGTFENLELNQQVCNLLQEKELVPKDGFVMEEPSSWRSINCSSDIMCCTLNAIPKTRSLLQKCRLPLGVLLHPFKALKQLPIVQSSVIVRCRSCRSYINPFVTFLDPGRWKCNICDRVNEVPTSFSYDRVTKSYGVPLKRAEVQNVSMEYVAPDEYLVRPPMPAVYLYLLDVSYNAMETGYLDLFCEVLLKELDKIPGDGRKQIGFLAYDSSLYFFDLSEGQSQVRMMVISDLEDPYVPCPEGLLVNLQQSKDLVVDLLKKLPSMFKNNRETHSALGSALQFAVKLMTPTGGRISVFQTILPTVGEGALKNREGSNEKNITCLGPATDFYKNVALECSNHQVALDLFMLNAQYADMASLDGISKFSAGCVHRFPNFHASTNEAEVQRFKSILSRYLTRKIGFEAVMRIRCSKGLSINGYHGNFFVRSTDLLNLPNVNPDAGYAVQLGLDEDLESNFVTVQAAVLYTSSDAERRIRIHNLCIPVSSEHSEVVSKANQLAIVGLLAKMAVDKSLSIGLRDSREAMVNTVVEILNASSCLSPGQKTSNRLLSPRSLRLVPLFVLALLKSTSFRMGGSSKIDDRIAEMETFKNLPWKLFFLHLHPYLYPVHNLDEKVLSSCKEEEEDLIRPHVVSLSSTQVDRHGAYVMDAGSYVYFYLGPAISDLFCLNVFGVNSVSQVSEGVLRLPELESDISVYLRTFISTLNDGRPFFAPLVLIKEGGKMKNLFYQHLIEDKTESSMSYQEFLHHICKEIKH